jgi:hypothetical protein
MQKIMKWFAPIFTLGVLLFIVIFLVSINSDEGIETQNKPLELEKQKHSNQPEKLWLNHLYKTKKEGYFYPVNEIYLKVDLDEKITKTITYKLSAFIKDPYQLFCLKEELKNHDLKYFLKKDRSGLELLIYSQNVDKLHSLVRVLKNYKISAQIKPYKED